MSRARSQRLGVWGFGLLGLTIALAIAVLLGLSGASRPLATTVQVVQTTADLSQHLTRLADLRFGTLARRDMPVIDVDDAVRYQRIVGVGASMTDTSAWLIHDELSPRDRATVMRNLFGADGIHLRMLRLPIGASDFTSTGRPYSYDDIPRGQADPRLSRFSVAHDDRYIVPTLRDALALDPGVEILATPWSPPAWMKTNHSLANPGDRGKLQPAAYGPLARYFVRFINAYSHRGIPVYAVTPQNEPAQETMRYPGLNLPIHDQVTFIDRYLAPALARARLPTKIYGLDSAWRRWRRAELLAHTVAAAGLVKGLAWHCYSGNPTVMRTLHDVARDLDQVVSECSTGIAPGSPAELLIASLRNEASAVLLWNIALDPGGGPLQRPNLGCPRCTGLITIDEGSHTVSYRSDYYQLGQLGKFVQPGARRISSNTFVTYNYANHLTGVDYTTGGFDDVAFRNPDGTKVLLAHNNGTRAIRFGVSWHGRAVTHTLPAGATVTLIWR